MFTKALILSSLFVLISTAAGQAARPNGQGEPGRLNPLVPGSPAFIAIINENCEISDRFFDGRCSNPSNPLYGLADRPVFSYVPGLSSSTFSSRGRPNAREISNAICDQEGQVLNDRNLNELLTFFGQFLDHNLVLSVVGTERENIEVPEGDPDTDESEFEFTRSQRAEESAGSPVERATNAISQILDLSAVYGSDEERARDLREGSEGRMKVSTGNLLPLNTENLDNDPSPSANFFVAGDPRSNETPMLSVLHTIWLREHNNIIDELLTSRTFNRLDGDSLFELARKINIAQFQKVVYDEFFPAIVGRSLPRYTGFDSSVNPTVSNIFSTAAYRIGHTMVGNGIQVLEGSTRTVLPFQSMFFAPPSVIQSRGIEPFLRGAMTMRCQEIDNQVVDALRNFLFTNVPALDDFDLISINIQRGRDHNIPSYNEIRSLFNIPVARSFADISSDSEVQARFASVYDSVDDVDAWPGLMSEDHVGGGSIGVTMRAIWTAEFTRLRDGDQFFFERAGLLPPQVASEVPRVRALSGSRSVFRDIILRNTNLSGGQVPTRPFFI